MQSEIIFQQQFTQALLQPDASLSFISKHADGAPTERINVHRNNVLSTWLDALRSGFPLTRQLLGEEYFDAVAHIYVRQSPPTSPVLQEYGHTFAHFLLSFEPLREFPYIPDIAKVEWRRRLAFHAADQNVLSLSQLRALPVELWLFKSFRWHSSLHLLLSAFPIQTLWRNQVAAEMLPDAAHWQGENVMIWRPQFELQQQTISDVQAQLLLSLKDGHNLAQAIEMTGQSLSEMSRQFMALVSLGCFAEWENNGE